MPGLLLDYTAMKRFRNPVLAALLAGGACLSGMAAGLSAAMPAWADQTDPRLNPLFERLRATESPEPARLVELMIWRFWTESGSAEIDDLMSAGAAAMEQGDFAQARDLLDQVIAARPTFAEAWNRRATMFYLAGDYPASLADIEHVLELEPRHFGALSGLGLVNLALGREEAALDAFGRVLALYPANEAARSNRDAIERQLKERDI